jgi:hypothetical protein
VLSVSHELCRTHRRFVWRVRRRFWSRLSEWSALRGVHADAATDEHADCDDHPHSDAHGDADEHADHHIDADSNLDGNPHPWSDRLLSVCGLLRTASGRHVWGLRPGP